MRDTGERPDDEVALTHLSETELAAFLDGGLTPPERHRVAAHIDLCETCRRELVDVGRAIEHRGARTREAPVSPSRRWWIPAAAAAGIAAILLVPRVATRPPATVGETRASRVADSEGQRRIDAISPADDVAIPAAQIVFMWHAVGADVYRVFLLSESGGPIWETETTDTSATLPATVSLTAGGAYFWRVDAVTNGIIATTRAHRLQVSRE
jgi:hypothetical protein